MSIIAKLAPAAQASAHGLPRQGAVPVPRYLVAAAEYFLGRGMPPSFAREHGFPELAEALAAPSQCGLSPLRQCM